MNEKLEEQIALNCGNEDDYDPYGLSEKFFNNGDIITLSLSVVYFTNGVENPIDSNTLVNRITMANKYFVDAKIDFKIKNVQYVRTKPEQNFNAMKTIQAVETISGKHRDDIRNAYYLEHFELWNSVYGKENTITMYLYDNVNSSFAGVAGGIGSTYFAMRVDFLAPNYHTLEHELGHCLGLYHTHEKDVTNGLNNETGDMVCDTYTSVDTLVYGVNNRCQYVYDIEIPNEHLAVLINNIMSYTKHECRASFTKVQNMRKRKIIESNADLRKAIVGYDTLKTKLWENLQYITPK